MNVSVLCQTHTTAAGKRPSHPKPCTQKGTQPKKPCTVSARRTAATEWRNRPRLSVEPRFFPVLCAGKAVGPAGAKSASAVYEGARSGQGVCCPFPRALDHRSFLKMRRWCGIRNDAATVNLGRRKFHQISSTELRSEQG